MYFAVLPQQIWFVLMMAVSGAALWGGGRPERRAALANVLAWLLTPLAYLPAARLQWGVLAVDAAFLGYLLYLALTTNRLWLLFATAFQLLGIVTHMATAADVYLPALPYRWGLVIWSYLVLASLAAGVWLHWGPPQRRSG
ncbi:hypothetical protein [Phenylobacterium sp.]|uniref:hypothetical protein n=1 Tax=Phenylobacterium sp. TaxID=1871053 RepID=UPI0008BE274C|nr:hypothetical protein [Phenylobacterium sp.]MBA4794084.1 hypothetical protein [Phenylobacterium sp.]OHB40508.1 MAG: hypothetical protein A2882_08905 [Phenylobacterium sp. RIFCSPHIGHO2_01_FULL_70_10]